MQHWPTNSAKRENVMDQGSFYGTAETGVAGGRIGRRYLRVALAITAITISAVGGMKSAYAQQGDTPSNPAPAPSGSKPNILMIMADDIGWFNVSAYNNGIMGYRTPNIDRIAKEGALFTDWYREQNCTAGRAALLTRPQTNPHGVAKTEPPAGTNRLHP